MAQFDVHRNSGQHRETIPFVVIVQSSLFDNYRRRVVVPLVLKSMLGITENRMNPAFTIAEVEVVLHPLEMVSVATEQLGEKVASLTEEGGRISDALDELLTRSWS
ncbi:MAG: CcdB family protein [Methylophilaceae bacterium]